MQDDLLFMSNRRDSVFELYRMAADGSGVQRVFKEHREANGMSWSPDGSKVLYTATPKGGQLNVFVTSLVDGQTQQLTHDDLPSSEPTWSPDGKTIAFVSSRSNARRIYLMDADGQHQRRLTSSAVDDEIAPRFSPDGTKLAYLASGEGVKAPPRLSVADLSSGKTRVISDSPERAIDASPTWSPDGKQILFTMIKGQTNHVFVMAVDGTGRKQLTGSFQVNTQPQWSPDGRYILYQSLLPESARLSVFVMNADGSRPRKLYGSGNNVMDARWSSDGQRVFYTEQLPSGAKVFSMDVAGQNIRRLSGNEGSDFNIQVCCDRSSAHALGTQ
jgi:Tol biopolymer transport system component